MYESEFLDDTIFVDDIIRRKHFQPVSQEIQQRESILQELHAFEYTPGFWNQKMVYQVQDLIISQYLNNDIYHYPCLPILTKQWEDLSKNSQKIYERTLKQIRRELPLAYEPLDLICLLMKTAREKSRSRYYTYRTCLIKLFFTNNICMNLIHLIPPYKDLCKYLGKETKGRVSANTMRRRSSKNIKTLLRLLQTLKPKYRAQALAIIYSGCRKTELPSLKIEIGRYNNREVYILSIKTIKTGCRRCDQTDSNRYLFVDLQSQGGFFWKTILRLYSPEPFHGIKPASLESAWRRARKKLHLEKDQGWCIHSLRHDFSSELKLRFMRSQKREVVQHALGHVDNRQTSIYGDVGNPSRFEPGVIFASEYMMYK